MRTQTARWRVQSAAYLSVLLGLCTGLAGCSGFSKAQPWEKGVLAKPAMSFETDRLDNAFVEHTYFSKEAASGGAGVGTGGCGCN